MRQFLVSAETGATAVSVIPSEWQPGYGPAPHQHEHEEVFLFLAGTGEGGVGEEQITICPGAAVIVPPQTTHWFKNTGSTPMRQVVVLASAAYTGPRAMRRWQRATPAHSSVCRTRQRVCRIMPRV